MTRETRASSGLVLSGALVLTAASLLLTHPLAITTTLLLALAFVVATGAHRRAPWLPKLALGLGLSVLAFNALFSWNGATVLYRAPFRIALMGRPILTLQAIVWGAVAGAQLATTALVLGAATLAVPPEALHRALSRIGAPAALTTAASLALRMVPDTTRDAQAMRRALRVRGLDTRGVKGTTHVLVPLTARALDRSLVAEEALTMRGYQPDASRRAGGGLPAAALWSGGGVLAAGLVALVGPGRPSFYPTLMASWAPVDVALVGLALVIPAWLVWEVVTSSR